MNKLTAEQSAAVESGGKVIVSASAGSGKTPPALQNLQVSAAGDGVTLPASISPAPLSATMRTFVMIEKLVRAIVGGADLDEILAVTFTKKAAAQMKDKEYSKKAAKSSLVMAESILLTPRYASTKALLPFGLTRLSELVKSVKGEADE